MGRLWEEKGAAGGRGGCGRLWKEGAEEGSGWRAATGISLPLFANKAPPPPPPPPPPLEASEACEIDLVYDRGRACVVQGGLCQLGPAQPDPRHALLAALNDSFNSYRTSTSLPSLSPPPHPLSHTLCHKGPALDSAACAHQLRAAAGA